MTERVISGRGEEKVKAAGSKANAVHSALFSKFRKRRHFMFFPATGTILFLIFMLCGLFSLNDMLMAKEAKHMVTASGALDQHKPDIEERKLALEKEKLELGKEKDIRDFNLEVRKAWLSALSIAVPLLAGLGAYLFQIWTQRRNESLQFKLKAAETAMNAQDSNQVKAKAAILKVLFSQELKEFDPEKFEPKQYPFSEVRLQSRSAFEERILIERFQLVAQFSNRLEDVRHNIARIRSGSPPAKDFQFGQDIPSLTALHGELKVNRPILSEELFDVLRQKEELAWEAANGANGVFERWEALDVIQRDAMERMFKLSSIRAT